MEKKKIGYSILPEHYLKIIEFFDLINNLYNFIYKKRLKCTIERLISLIISSKTSDGIANPNTSIIDKISTVHSIIPSIMNLCQIEDEENKKSVELTFLKYQGSSKINTQKRKDFFLKSTVDKFIKISFNLLNDPDIPFMKFKKSIANESTLFNIDKNQIPLPILDITLSNFYEKSVYSIYNDSITSITNEIKSDIQNEQDCPNIEPFSLEKEGIDNFLAYLKKSHLYNNQIEHIEIFEARPPKYLELERPVNLMISNRLEQVLNIKRFYSHQAKAIDALKKGNHVSISTSTASGKSVIYNVPVLEAILLDPSSTSIYVFPTKVEKY